MAQSLEETTLDDDIDKALTPKTKRLHRGELTKTEKAQNVRKQLFSDSWLSDNRFVGWLQPVSNQPTRAKCISCHITLGSKKSDIIRHSKSNHHLQTVSSIKNVLPLTFTPDQTNFQIKVQKAELRQVLYLVCHNISFNSVNHLSQLQPIISEDSKVAKHVSLKRTKCTQIIKNVFSKTVEENIVNDIKKNKFSIYLDESTDISNTKLLAVLVKYFSNGKLQTQMLDLIPINADNGTALGLFTLFKNSLNKLNLTTKNIVGYCADNASVMMGCNESFKSYLLKENPYVVINGCICHTAHLIASSGASCLPNRIETLLHNIYTYFSRSPKRQAVLREFQTFMKESQVKILQPSQTRWLSLHKCVDRILDQWDVLKQLFTLAQFEDKNPVAKLIYQEMQNPYNKAYMCFLQFILPLINSFNAFFQSDKVLIFKIYEESTRFIRVICSKFLKTECYINNLFDKLDFKNPSHILPNDQICIGEDTRTVLNSCHNRSNYQEFMNIVIYYYQKIIEESIKRLPINDVFYIEISFVNPKIILNNSTININHVLKRLNFNNKKKEIMNEISLICNYFSKTDIKSLPTDVVEFWMYIKNLKDYNDCAVFPNLSELALVVLTLPHGNAGVERVFSIVTDIKTKKRNRLTTSTLKALVRTKLDVQNSNKCCLNYDVTEQHLKKFNQCIYENSDSDEESSKTD